MSAKPSWCSLSIYDTVPHTPPTHGKRTAMVGEFYEALNSLGVDMEVVGDVHAMRNLDSLLNG